MGCEQTIEAETGSKVEGRKRKNRSPGKLREMGRA